MLKKNTTRIKRNRVPLERLKLVKNTYDAIVEEMARGAEICRPSERWQVNSLFDTAPEKKDAPSFEDMMPAWVGARAKIHVTEAIFDEYADYIRSIDHLDLLSAYYPDNKFTAGGGLMVCDLGSIIEVNLITKNLSRRHHQPLNIMEVGGGYGRLAEVFLNLFGGQIRYFLVDAVPLSLYYGYHYLSGNLPRLQVNYMDNSSPDDISACDCIVLPCWNLNKIKGIEFDVCINIASMQEMTEEQVGFFLDLFEAKTRTGGLIYLSNSRDYVYQRNYFYPDNWELLEKIISPRAYSPDYPIEIFRRGRGSFSSENTDKNEKYLLDVCGRYRGEISRLNKSIQAKTELLHKHKQLTHRLRERLEQQADSVKGLREKNEDLRNRLASSRKETESTDRQGREKIQYLEDRIRHQSRTIRNLRSRIDQQNRTISDLRDKTAKLRAKALDSANSEKRFKIEHKQLLRDLRSRIDQQRRTIEDLRIKTKRLRSMLSDANESAKQSKMEYKQLIKTLRGRIGQQRQTISQTRRKADQYHQAMNELASKKKFMFRLIGFLRNLRK
jgi:hypothetical protein